VRMPESVLSLAKNCPTLLDVGLNGVRIMEGSHLIILAEMLKNLQKLDICWNRKVSETEIEKIIVECPQLQYLYLTGCRQVKSDFKSKMKQIYPHLQIL